MFDKIIKSKFRPNLYDIFPTLKEKYGNKFTNEQLIEKIILFENEMQTKWSCAYYYHYTGKTYKWSSKYLAKSKPKYITSTSDLHLLREFLIKVWNSFTYREEVDLKNTYPASVRFLKQYLLMYDDDNFDPIYRTFECSEERLSNNKYFDKEFHTMNTSIIFDKIIAEKIIKRLGDNND